MILKLCGITRVEDMAAEASCPARPGLSRANASRN